MRSKIIGILVSMLLIGLSGIAIADWDEEDGHKMHFPQLPDPSGFDVFCTAEIPQFPPVVLADDWKCPESGWIKDIHFWGSWLNDDIGSIDHFVMGIAENIPAEENPNGDWSMPGDTLKEWTINDWIERGPYNGEQGWYWPIWEPPEWIYPNHQLYWQYNIFLEEEDWFWQDEGTIYWLFISAIVNIQDPQPIWGWKSTYEDLHFMDDACWAFWGDLFWLPLTYPTGLTMDLAFVVNGGEPEPIPDLDCDGNIIWTNAKPADTLTDTFIVKNIGDPGSLLNWEVTNTPVWGTWTITPSSGTGLAAGSSTNVTVTCIAPNEPNAKFTGEIEVCNKDDSTDCCKVPVTLKTPRNRAYNQNIIEYLFERFPHLFPILKILIKWVK